MPSFRQASPKGKRGYVSPFDKFIKEQTEIYQKQRQARYTEDEANSEQTPISLTAASSGLESAPFQNRLNEVVCNHNDQNALLNTSMPSTIILDNENSEAGDLANNN